MTILEKMSVPTNIPKIKYHATFKNSPTQKLYNAYIMLSLNHKGRVEVIKNRYMGNYKDATDLTEDETVDILLTILCSKLYNGCTEIFQEGLKIKLKEKILKMIEKEK